MATHLRMRSVTPSVYEDGRVEYIIVIARVLGIYGSKPTRVRGWAVYVAINP